MDKTLPDTNQRRHKAFSDSGAPAPEVSERLLNIAIAAIRGRGVSADDALVSRIVLSPVLADLQQQVMALKPYEDGRISKGLVLAILRGELDG